MVEAKEIERSRTRKQGASAKLKEFFIQSPEAGIISKLNASYVSQFFKQSDNLLEIIHKADQWYFMLNCQFNILTN